MVLAVAKNVFHNTKISKLILCMGFQGFGLLTRFVAKKNPLPSSALVSGLSTHYHNFNCTFSYYSLKVNMFCAFSQQKVFGPVFIAESIITGAYSLIMLGNWLWPQLRVDISQELIHSKQDGAPPHFHRELWKFLDKQVPGSWIGEQDKSLGLWGNLTLTH